MATLPKRGQRAATNKATQPKRSSFKTCPGCPSPATCKARGECAKKAMLRKTN
jgi:hypothetical protein